MGHSKFYTHTIEQNRTAKIFKALAHPARIAILEYISKNPNSTCNDMVNAIDLAQATISQHLSELRAAQFIKGKSSGKKVYYSINIDNWYRTHQTANLFFKNTQ
ncbi:metalloregulator ArsR/SmtB family transcription factor [Leptobacterium sp. I13]|uniref:ArsR/SmtB family transcription factor n=1 Tax=Leptobacterium meishanense TaxID=3128904 RepID=UPI0030EF32D4